MRVGVNQYVAKDHGFYLCQLWAVLGHATVAVYEALRFYVWRSTDRGGTKAKEAYASGKLVTVVSQTKIAETAGVARSTVCEALHKLRDLGWVRGEVGGEHGEVLGYELGVHAIERGEHFYADAELRMLYEGQLLLAEKLNFDSVRKVPAKARREFTEQWIKDRVKSGVSPRVSAQQTPEVSAHRAPGVSAHRAPGAHSADTEKKREKRKFQKRKKVSAELRSAEPAEARSAHSADTCPSTLTREEPDSPIKKTNSKTKEENSKTKDKNEVSSSKNDFLHPPVDFNLNKMAASNSKVSYHDSGESYGGTEKNDEERRQAVAAAMEAGKKKADQQRQVNEAKRRIRSSRTAQVKQKQAKEQKAANLRGRSYPRDVVEAAKRAWATYTDLVTEYDPDFVVPRWAAKGNVKSRGQMCQLVEMYGGPATEQALQYLIGNWDVIGSRYFKNSPGGTPNLGRLVVLHEQIYRESVVWGRHHEVLRDWNEWYRGREYTAPPPPEDLRARYEKAREALESLGLGA